MSLYRQYRPKTFEDVAGQSPIVETLNQAVKQDKLAHAYLFAGIRGTGKTSIARILAKELLTRGVDDPVLRENIVKAIDEGNLVDLTEIDAASNRGIDDIRSLLEKIQFTPVVAKAKVYIIDEVHMLTREAFNALLKTLEEPPSYAYFILATTELHKIPATIQSRCQRFLFRQIKEEDIIGRLQFIADTEHISIEHAALKAIAHHSGGSMRDAISLLDQMRSLSTEISIKDVKERIGESGHEYVAQILTALDTADRTIIVEAVRSMEEAAVPLENVSRLLLEEVRNQLHTAVHEKKNTSRLLHILDRLMDTIRDLRIAPVPGLVLESALLSLTESPVADIPATPVSQEKSVPVMVQKATPAMTAPAPVAAPVTPPVVQKESPGSSSTSPASMSFTALKAEWPKIVESAEPAFVRMSLKNGRLHAIDGNTVIVAFGSAFHRDKASSNEGARSVDEALERAFHLPLRLKCVLEIDVKGTPAMTEESVNLAEAAADIF
jgi:DNA polymerase-3 subunit gamma/tau